MCGIWGVKRDVSYILDIVKANERRGGYSFGLLNVENGTFEIVKDWQDNWRDYLNDIFRAPHFGQFRAPTTDGDKETFKWNENYPLVYMMKDGRIAFLFGNGVINANFFKKLVDEFGKYSENDLYYIGLGILERGFDFLNDVDGTFALALVMFNNNQIESVYLMRNTFPLYFNDDVYSSVKVVNDMKMLENGVVYDWWNNREVFRFQPKEVPFLVGGL